jgi:hypothetical protein
MRRPVCRKADAELCNQFKLKRWIRNADRRAIYFKLCFDSWTTLAEIASQDEPSQQAMLGFIALALDDDPSFDTFVRKRDRSTMLSKRDAWDDLQRACAAMVLDEYLDAIDNGGWQ